MTVLDPEDPGDSELGSALGPERDCPARLAVYRPLWPFGVVKHEPTSDPGTHLLWADAYEESDHVSADGRQISGVNDTVSGGRLSIPAGDRATETDTLVDDLAPGEHALRNSVAVSVDSNETGETLPIRVSVWVGPPD